jgi:hypothetical protein
VDVLAGATAGVPGRGTLTVSRCLTRIRLRRLSRLDPIEPPNPHERRRAGELVHVDVKRLGRIGIRGAGHRVTRDHSSQFQFSVGPRRLGATGWEFVHVCVDDATRVASAEEHYNFRRSHGCLGHTPPAARLAELEKRWGNNS